MNSFQESKNELEAAIRYAENAISSAQGTIESMEFRQEMAKKNYQEQTGRESMLEGEVAELTTQVDEAFRKNKSLQNQVGELKSECALLAERIDEMKSTAFADANTIKHLQSVKQELESKVQGQYDDIVMLEREVEVYTKKYNELVQQKEASSGPCGCQAYRNLEEKVGDLESEVNALEQPERPTMPVIPKAVAIAIFREGVQHGVSSACDEIDNDAGINIEETGYTGDFEVSFNKHIDLSEHLDLDWMRDKVGDYDEASVIEALKFLCADKEFECRIHGVDDAN